MAYVPTEDLKRMCRILVSHAEIVAANYCFAWKHDDPGDVEDVTMQVLEHLGKEVELAKSDKS